MKKFKTRCKNPWTDRLSLLVPVILIAVVSCSSASKQPSDSVTTEKSYTEGVPGGIFVSTFVVEGKIVAIEKTERRATILGTDGKKVEVKAGPEAVNFYQIQVNDLVRITGKAEAVIYLNEKGATPRDESSSIVMVDPKGDKPGGMMANTIQKVGTVKAIDPKKRTATLRFEDGTVQTFMVRKDIDLSKRKVGEKVVFRLTEIIAISVEKR